MVGENYPGLVIFMALCIGLGVCNLHRLKLIYLSSWVTWVFCNSGRVGISFLLFCYGWGGSLVFSYIGMLSGVRSRIWAGGLRSAEGWSSFLHLYLYLGEMYRCKGMDGYTTGWQVL